MAITPYRRGGSDVEIVDGGTDASDAATALVNLSALDTTTHALVDHAGLPGVDGASTSLSMSGDLVLSDAFTIDQFLDPNGADRLATLPATAATNHSFRIINTGLFVIRVLEASGVLVRDILPDQSVKIIPSGTGWAVGAIEDYAQLIVGQNYNWGGNLGGGNFFIANQIALAGGQTGLADNIGAFHVVQRAGTIDELAWLVANENAIEAATLYVNGVAQDQLVFTGGASLNNGAPGRARWPTPVSVSVGDRIALASKSGTNEVNLQVRVRNSTPGYLVQFGGDLTASNAFYSLHENWNVNRNQTVEDTNSTAVLIGSGNLVSIGYSIQDGTTLDTLDIVLNGSTDQTVTLSSGALVGSSLVGIETLTGTFVEGDTLAVRGASTSPDDAVIGVLTDVAGHCHQFKGNPSALSGFRAWDGNDNAGGVTFQENDARVQVRNFGRPTVSWNSQSLPTSDLILIKNMIESYTFTGWNTLQGVTDFPFPVRPGDTLSIHTENGVGGRANLLLVVR